MSTNILRAARAAAIFASSLAVLAPGSAAQFFNCTVNCHVVGGNVSDGSGGPFLPGNVYLANTNLTVPAGQTLTVGAGAIIKFSGVRTFTVDGTLIVNGSAANPAVITSIDDDIGGDHNGNGSATSPAAGQWTGVVFGSGSSASQAAGLSVRHAGWNGNSAIRFASAAPALIECSTIAAAAACLDLGSNSLPTLVDCHFQGGTRVAINVHVAALAGFSSCTAAGQTQMDAPEISVGTFASGSLTVTVANTMNGSGAVVADTSLAVSAGATLTLGPGVVIKFTGVHSMTVSGTLVANGTGAAPVVLTSIHDDAYGGDTNLNQGATAPSPGNWIQLHLGPTSDASNLSNMRIRYAGWNGNSVLRLSESDATCAAVTTELSGGPGLTLSNNSFPTLTGCAFNSGIRAAVDIPVGAFSGFSGCNAAGNTVYDAPEMGTYTVGNGQSMSLNAANAFNGNGVIVVAGTISVQAGGTLSLGEGLRLKMAAVVQPTISGTLLVNGNPSSPVVMTSIHDDAIGGDTNKNGAATLPSPGAWVGLFLEAGSGASSLSSLLVRYAGWNGHPAVRLNSSDATLHDVRVRYAGNACLSLMGNSFPTVTGCAFDDSIRAAVGIPIGAFAGFSNCTATGNSTFDAPEMGDFTVLSGQAVQIQASNAFNGDGVIVTPGSITIQANGALTLGAGVRLKKTGVHVVTVHGTLIANGTAGEPVVMTSIDDDSIGGDTNKNGAATLPAPGAWLGVRLEPGSDASVLDSFRSRYAGWNGNHAIRLSSSNATLQDVRVQFAGAACLSLMNNSFPLVANSAFTDSGRAVVEIPIGALAGFSGCTASGNTVYDAPELGTYAVSAGQHVLIQASNAFNGNGVFVAAGGISVAFGGILEIGTGVRIKIAGVQTSTITGTLLANGTKAAPVTFTSIHDDSVGGDTNKNGNATSAQPGHWVGMVFQSGSQASLIKSLRIRCAGWNGNATLRLTGSDATFEDLRTALCGGNVLDLANNSFPSMLRCAFDGGSLAANNVHLRAIAGFRQCTAAGNSVSNGAVVSNGTLSTGETAEIRAINTMNGDGGIHMAAPLSVQAGATLNVHPGVVFKFDGVREVSIAGTANFRGSGHDPVVFTSIHDDEFGGDTNANGIASQPAPGHWVRLRFQPGASGVIQHARIRYAGWNGNTGFLCQSPGVSVSALRVDRCQGIGIHIEAAAGTDLDNLVAWQCGSPSIRFDTLHLLRHATCAEGSGIGIRTGVSGIGPGSAIGCISYGNAGANFEGFAANAVTFSAGLAPGTGNFDLDPLFVNAPAGDLSLQGGSPCIGAADVLTAFDMVTDHDEGSRLSDGLFQGFPSPDMGAYEHCAYRLRVEGHVWSYGFVSITIDGPPGIVYLALGPGNEPPTPYIPYGFLLAGQLSSLFVFDTLAPGIPLAFPLGDLSIASGADFALQALAGPSSAPGLGSFTNIYRGTVDG